MIGPQVLLLLSPVSSPGLYFLMLMILRKKLPLDVYENETGFLSSVTTVQPHCNAKSETLDAFWSLFAFSKQATCLSLPRFFLWFCTLCGFLGFLMDNHRVDLVSTWLFAVHSLSLIYSHASSVPRA